MAAAVVAVLLGGASHHLLRRRSDALWLLPTMVIALVAWTYLAPPHFGVGTADAIKFGLLAAVLYAFLRYRRMRE